MAIIKKIFKLPDPISISFCNNKTCEDFSFSSNTETDDNLCKICKTPNLKTKIAASITCTSCKRLKVFTNKQDIPPEDEVEQYVCKNCKGKTFNFFIFENSFEQSTNKQYSQMFSKQDKTKCLECGNIIEESALMVRKDSKYCHEHFHLNKSLTPEFNTFNTRKSNVTDTKFPPVPKGMRSGCPTCKTKKKRGIVTVYQNQHDKSFFLGCSEYPKCIWTSNKFSNELNNNY